MAMNMGEVRSTEGIPEVTERALGESRAVQSESASRNAPQRIIENLKASLPKMHKGGVVAKTGPVILQKGETVIPAQSDQSQQDPQATQPDASTQSSATGGQDDESASGAPVSLQKAYSLINERLCQLFDASGLKRSFSIPYLKNQETADHVNSIGQKLQEVGGVTKNFILTFHHAGGKGWHSEDGMTVGHPIDSLKKTLITKEKPEAIAALSATKSFLNKMSGLIGDTKTLDVAKSQLAMVGRQKGEGMDLMDFGSALIALVSPPLQEIARTHHNTKGHGPNHARLSPPRS
jgi:hypothetical protein